MAPDRRRFSGTSAPPPAPPRWRREDLAPRSRDSRRQIANSRSRRDRAMTGGGTSVAPGDKACLKTSASGHRAPKGARITDLPRPLAAGLAPRGRKGKAVFSRACGRAEASEGPAGPLTKATRLPECGRRHAESVFRRNRQPKPRRGRRAPGSKLDAAKAGPAGGDARKGSRETGVGNRGWLKSNADDVARAADAKTQRKLPEPEADQLNFNTRGDCP